MSFMFRLKRRAGNMMLALGLVLATTFFLVGCGSSTLPEVSPGPNATSAASTTPTLITSPTTQTVSQPKVVAQGRDAQGGTIEFTEPPVAGDGVPVFIMFETEN